MDNSSPENLIVVKKEPDGIAYVTINRPKSLNSLTRPMMVDLARAFNSLSSDDSVGVIILSGMWKWIRLLKWEWCRKPIIGAVSGFSVTAGYEISLACDILIASTDAKFVDTHATFGLILFIIMLILV
ncbi:putative enoyl-CoA hydratase/isomerase, ClpP/crotonase-like domain superfamily [Helianthus annuus]|uniref:Enoyl-CoA hydratase/isomerase, ClpP/crotonase-like domain superfamily n=1 Tax=Helianthus annuus TaxID=4232 RepID=A0A251T2R4_HELAN|nr:putative enoyl-CoA hydratase/isomerase, ClpP/crotonase-like domain superfamily [Helianthus annuus]KAJ0863043.1 putative enoyl-CoA hydratase/isomerase, ClpP/crotonase-like domain superfamily [Helianthus annuus]